MTFSKRLLLVGALASLSVTAALAILILLFGDFGDTEARILGTTVAISVASLLALPGAILLERRTSVLVGWASVSLAVTSFAWAQVVIWGGDSVTAGKLLGTLVVWAVASTQIAALQTRRRHDDPRAVGAAAAGATALALLLASLVSFAIWAELEDSPFFRIIAALTVLDVFLVVMQPILRRLQPGGAATALAVLEGTQEQIDEALRRVEGTGVTVRR
ncbi:MAG: hypothetical protein ABI717_04990 [Actinomycetota bacterium]